MLPQSMILSYIENIADISYGLEVSLYKDLVFFDAYYWTLQELRETLAEELDFEHEAHNQERCAHDMVDFPYVYIPKVMM